MAIGEAGKLSANTSFEGEPIAVTFTEPLTDPVVVLTGTNFGGNKFSIRVLDIQTNADGDATGFTFTIDEWENHDGRHPRVEDFNWLAVESGVHTLPDGRVIEAGHSSADSNGETVSLSGTFATPPVVVTTVASNDGTSYTDSDPSNITSSGFTLTVEEAESQDGVHGLEDVGWIAIQPGGDGSAGTALNSDTVDSSWDETSLGATFTDGVVLAETQTRDDTDPGNVILRNQDGDSVDIRFEEDTSVDSDGGHAAEGVGIVTFEDGLILCFTAGTKIATPHGDRLVEDLRPGDPVLTRDSGVQLLRWTCAQPVDADLLAEEPSLAPVRIPKDSFGTGLPAIDTWVSPQHRLLTGGPEAELLFGAREVLVPAKGLFAADPLPRLTCYIHLLFDHHEIILANDLPMESFHPGDMIESTLTGAAREELFALAPDLRTAPNAWGPTARLALRPREAALLAA
ncbi:hemolysin [Roseobacter sp. HKCCD9010]|uniref:Hint domain-containing protein n=1 Tax=unclassified Roseobacter TaxID=196798 RepID=UPI001490EC8F|nr:MULTISPECIES: Hint domain-containing protein [unclassified Roseobacter]MBF9049479.1 hemolysin [Rhodobacterales bacterium HKCCD4356]NNV11479.1 hemolysin [Roseobacter sp. HKCCD7357]NNV15663.1 hemolysin [Roseobacter sp. HKCCD8768]NNV25123.1 hemolysin [Roseobacter sp. HKCCD8192]NNV29380.1 hemolysin [Roseobacter sp. HKCCD9061]